MTEQQGDTKTTKVRIKGRVQGVLFRSWTIEKAQSLNLRGWVRNREDGSVEAVFSGPGDTVDAMVDSCRNGPSSAAVENLDATPSKVPTNQGFIQLGTC